jgi:hypothetical protein
MLGFGLLALGALVFGATLFFIRFLFRREVGAYIDRVAELERRLALTRSAKRRLEHQVDGLRRDLVQAESRLERRLTSFPRGPRPESS